MSRNPSIFRPRLAALTAITLLALLLGGCGQEAGVVFPMLANPPCWPPPPEPPRIRYVGQLTGSADLKPGQSGLDTLGTALFGEDKKDFAFGTPMAVCTDGGDRVFVADTTDHVIHVLNLKSRQYQRWVPKDRQLQTAVGLAYDTAAGRLLVADSGGRAILVFAADGQYQGTLAVGKVGRPCGIAIDPTNGRIFVVDVDAHQLVVLSPAGEVIRRVGSRGNDVGQFNYPTNVVVDRHGLIYVSDTLNFRIQQFGPDLLPIRQIGKQGDMPGYFAQPKGIAVDGDDHLYVIDSQFEAVQIYDSTGTLLLTFGEEGRQSGEFWLPGGIMIDHQNRIWIADAFNHRVQVFDYLPEAPK